jgi:hypothetical protein
VALRKNEITEDILNAGMNALCSDLAAPWINGQFIEWFESVGGNSYNQTRLNDALKVVFIAMTYEVSRKSRR